MPDSLRSESLQSSYNSISGTYDRRYAINPLKGVADALRDLVRALSARWVLEVGCGTGYWLKTLLPNVQRIIGLDASVGMLRKAFPLPASMDLVCGSANSLPFAGKPFDLIFVVNAVHHFEDKRGFINQARQLLNAGGILGIVAMDISSAMGHSVIYDYFPGALEFDQSRFPSWEEMKAWMSQAGLDVQPLRTVERVCYEKHGAAILEDHFIQRHGNSQFMRMTDTQYQSGIDRIKSVIAAAKKRGETAVFKTEFQLQMIVGWVRK
jgi:SAM-dependent methyltransferase